MKLKTITLIAAIFGALSALCSIYHFIRFMIQQVDIQLSFVDTFITWPISILSQCSLVVFLFVLFNRQQS